MQLLWQTANEINVSHFNIQRSNNGKDFINIGKINASCCEYSFVDDLKTKDQDLKTLYYKLEIVDKDGSKTYSTIQQITIKPQTANNVFIYPNPAKDVVNIECKDGIREMLIIDNLRKTIKKQIINNQQSIINIQGVAKGIYLLQVFTNKGDVKNEKLIVQ